VSAILSPCGRYRYTLSRGPFTGLLPTEPAGRTVMFLMLNPSTADAEVDDPTIRRCIGFAKAWRFERMTVGNLFAWRATDPAELRTCPSPVGPANSMHLADMMGEAEIVIAAWGAASKVPPKLIGPRVAAARELAMSAGKPLHCIRRTQGGQPEHPLYLPASLTPVPWGPP
jgi:hypothetical protein